MYLHCSHKLCLISTLWDPAQRMPSLIPLLVKLVILSDLRAIILCLPRQASQFR